MRSMSSISRSVEIGLRVIGVWPGMSYAFFYWAFWFTSLALAQAFQYRHVIMHIGSQNLSRLMDGLSTTMSYSLLYFKLIIFWTNRGTFRDIVSAMATDWNEESNDVEYQSDRRPMTKMAYLSHRSSNLIIALYSMSVVLYAAGVIVSQSGEIDTIGNKEREFLLKMEFPFESNISPVYEVVMVMQFLHQLAAATIVGVLNALIVSLILHVAGQIDLVCRSLIEMPMKSKQTWPIKLTMNLLIQKHQRIIKFSNSIENLFRYIALMQFLWNTLVICALGFVIVSALNSSESSAMLVKSLFFYLVITLEAFIFCYAGEYLSEKGRTIGKAAYETAWYDWEPRDAKLLVSLILRSEKRLTITIGKFTDLSLAQFTTIIRASASYVSVLNAMS